jgi:hypothetical protein
MVRQLCAISIVLICTTSVAAQTGSVRGHVSDPQHVAIADATVTLTREGQMNPKTARTGADGTFELSGIEPGTYTLRIEAAGFDPSTHAVNVNSGSERVDVILQIAGLAEHVVVAASKLEEEPDCGLD